MRQAGRAYGPSSPAHSDLRGYQSGGQCALWPAMSVLVLALIGCTHPAQTGSNAAAPGRPLLSVADAALASGAPDMALRVADLILRDAPRNVPALVAKGDALYAMGQYDLARGAYRGAVAVDPSAVGTLIGLGRTLVRTDPKAAEAAFLDAAMRAPNNVTALSNLGLARDLQGQHATAQDAYRQALAVAPDMADVKLNLGLSLALSGKAADAIAQLHPLVGETGSTDVSPHDLAAALTVAGDQVEANLVLRGDPRPADLEAPPAIANPPETPLVAVASLSGHRATAPEASAETLLDIRPAPVIAVMGVPGFDVSGGSGTAAAPIPHQAQVTTPIQMAGIERPSGLRVAAPMKPAATITGVAQAASRLVGAVPQLPGGIVLNPPTAPVHPPRSSVPIANAPGSVSRNAASPAAISPVAISAAAVSRATVSRLAVLSVAVSAVAVTPTAVTPVMVPLANVAAGEVAGPTGTPDTVAPPPSRRSPARRSPSPRRCSPKALRPLPR